MNKKAQLGSGFVFGMVGLFILILILVSLIPIQLGGTEPDKIYSSIENSSSTILNRFETNESNGVIINMVNAYIKFVLYISFEVTKVAVKYAVEHPDFVNAKTLLWIVIISLCIPIIYYLFLMIIVLFLLIREWFLIKKEKRLREGCRNG